MSGSDENQEYMLDKEPEIVIPLENFKYSNTTNADSYSDESTIGFLGRTEELARLQDHLVYGHKNNDFRGPILVSGDRGAGKTRFVNEALLRYRKKYRKESQKNFIEIKINLGSEKDINTETVLSNMVSLLLERLEDKFMRV